MNAALRMIDANNNRAREALRTLEDVARFAWNDAGVAEEAKSLRHALQSAIAAIPALDLAAARDVAGDIGTALEGANEYARADLSAVAQAAGGRLSEALRVIEEAAKTLGDATIARAVEQVRYRSYALAAEITLRIARARPRQFALCLLLTRALCRRDWRDVVREAVEGGVDLVQVREKEMDAGELVAHVRAVRETIGTRATLVVNDRLDVALAANADGVHLGTTDLPLREARKIAGPRFLIGASTHTLDEARAAVAAGADLCGVGAMYASTLKPDLAPSGEAYLRAFLAEFPCVPHLAIGGIAAGRVAALARAGCRGIAVSSAICGADRPGEVARALRRELAETTEVSRVSSTAAHASGGCGSGCRSSGGCAMRAASGGVHGSTRA
ncbi:MAG: thiamine phosphate synthase [Limnohabitans sp.]|nr:thiamine phosphate synthase [Limnohabitans sp.]